MNTLNNLSLVCPKPNKVYAKYKHSAYTQFAPYKGEAHCVELEKEDNTTLCRNSRGKAILFVKNEDDEFIPLDWIKKKKA